MNKKYFTVLVILIIVLLVVVLFFLLNKNKQAEMVEEQQEEPFDWSSLEYSRISFFNGSEHRASINFPEIWEGEYRLKEEGSAANFYWLHEDGTTTKIFSVRKVNDLESSPLTICRSGDMRFDYHEYDFEIFTGQSEIKDGLKYIKDSFKCF